MRSEVQLLPDPPYRIGSRVEQATTVPPVAKGQADGAIAQLGERRVCNAKVVGSIPTGSTNYSITACHESFLVPAELAGGMPHGMRARARMCSLKIRQFVLMSNMSASSVFGVAFENQLIE